MAKDCLKTIASTVWHILWLALTCAWLFPTLHHLS